MENEESKIDPNSGIEAVRIWYRDWRGIRASVVKYKDPYGHQFQNDKPSDAQSDPIYVALGNHQPEPLIDVLEELDRFRSYEKSQAKTTNIQFTGILDRLRELERPKTKRRWWKR